MLAMVKSSKIFLKNIRFHAYHGVLEQENTVGNDYLVNLSLEYDFTRAIQTDELSGTINYAEVYELLKREMAKPNNYQKKQSEMKIDFNCKRRFLTFVV